MVSQAALISAQVALDAAQADLHVAESNHALAKRALRQSELRAPFDGSVVARLLQPQADTAPGQTVLQIEGRGRLQAVATLPAEIAQALSPDKVIQEIAPIHRKQASHCACAVCLHAWKAVPACKQSSM